VSLVPLRLVAAAALGSLLVAGCAGPGRGIADRIRAANSPIVREVYLSPANAFGGKGDEIQIFVPDNTTEAEKLSLWCEVMLPAGAADMPPGTIGVYEGVPGAGHDVLRDPACPSNRSPAVVRMQISSASSP
jgi:hypothetical protein